MRILPTHTPRTTAVLLDLCDARGTSAAEYTIMMVFVALVALGAWGALGGAVEDKTECAARAIASGASDPCAIAGAQQGRDRPAGAHRDALSNRRGGDEDSDSGGEAPPDSSAYRTESQAFRDRAAGALDKLEAAFQPDADKVSWAEIEQYAHSQASSPIAEVHAALVHNPSLRYALDVGSGAGEVDGVISRADIQALREMLRTASDEELYLALADTASGDGGRDGYVSRVDALAVLDDSRVPPEIRDRATVRLGLFEMCDSGVQHAECEAIEAKECGGWKALGCMARNAASAGGHLVTDPIGSVEALAGGAWSFAKAYGRTIAGDWHTLWDPNASSTQRFGAGLFLASVPAMLIPGVGTPIRAAAIVFNVFYGAGRTIDNLEEVEEVTRSEH